MSFVVTTPDEIQAAARNLAGIRSLLAESSASAAAPTAGMVAAAQDQVSVQVAAFLGAYGQEYQAISAQAQVFHEQFVNLVSSGAGAYLGTELANAQQNLMNAVNAPVQGLLGNSAAAGGVVAAAASGLTAAPAAALPLLGGAVTAILRGGAPVGQALNGAVSAIQNGSAAPLLSGQIGSGLQTLSGGIVGLPTGLAGLERALAPGLPAPAASAGPASVDGPQQTLLADTAAHLNVLGAALMTNPAPFLHPLLGFQIGYAQAIAVGAEYILQNFPAVLASLPANIQAFIQAVLAFNPVPYAQQFIAHQMAYAQIIATSLQTAHDFGAGLQASPAAFQSAFGWQAGDITGAVTDISQGFVNLFVTGVAGDLLPILAIPGMMAQNFTNLLPAGSIPAPISAPYNPAAAASAGASQFVGQVQTGDFGGAIDAPAVVANAFFNGQSTLPIGFNLGSYPSVVNPPMNGLLASPIPYIASVSGVHFGPLTVPVGGAPISGLATGPLSYAPEQLARAITPIP